MSSVTYPIRRVLAALGFFVLAFLISSSGSAADRNSLAKLFTSFAVELDNLFCDTVDEGEMNADVKKNADGSYAISCAPSRPKSSGLKQFTCTIGVVIEFSFDSPTTGGETTCIIRWKEQRAPNGETFFERDETDTESCLESVSNP
jgi:hypothetical protein